MFMKVIFAMLLAMTMIPPVFAQELWVGKDGNIRNVDSRAMVIDDGGIYLATRKELYRALDAKSKWEEVFSIPSGENEITCMNGNSKNIFIGTKRGLFRAQGGSRSWRSIFRTILPEKNNILCIEKSRYSKSVLLIGTERGVFISEDLGTSWQDISYNLKNKRVSCIGMSKDTVYAASSDGLYSRKIDAPGWERIYVKSASSEKPAGEETPDSDSVEAEDELGSVSCIAFKGSRIYAGIDRNILYSDDGGKAWIGFARAGLAGGINYILPSRKTEKLYCATTKGVFEFDKNKAGWLELYKGMDKPYDIRSIIFEGEQEIFIWAITEGGLYRLESGRFISDQYIDVERNLKSFRIASDNEPAFRELQQAALRFGDVSPDKIRKWHQESRLRALVPKVSVGYDNNRSTNSEIYTSATKDYVIMGPDDMTSGLDVSISWDLANLIWSDDQTNIDVRSRLTTQLRNDILDDLRRAYFERRRLQFEMMANPPKDTKARFDKELRIQELTQAIDDLTGNYLSEHTRK